MPCFTAIASCKQFVILLFERFLSGCSHIPEIADFGDSVTCTLIGGNLMSA